MADSGITRRALARSFASLAAEKPMEKISISEIAAGCEMNRKSFYYHFIDKYHLLQWIFDSEYVAAVDTAAFLPSLCGYLAQNPCFWRKALALCGSGCFKEHLREYLMQQLSVQKEDRSTAVFYADGTLTAIERWLEERCDEPEALIAGRLEKILSEAGVYPAP